jgi:hydrogenase expression/formation protein HypC
MCLAIPMKIEKIDRKAGKAVVEGGAEVDITLVPGAKKGEFLLVHSGLAVQSIGREEAEETLKLVSSCNHTHPHEH